MSESIVGSEKTIRRLNHPQNFQLCDYIRNLSEEGIIKMTAEALANKAAQDLGFRISAGSVTRAANTVEVLLERCHGRSISLTEGQTLKMQLEAHEKRLRFIEYNLNLLATNAGIEIGSNKADY